MKASLIWLFSLMSMSLYSQPALKVIRANKKTADFRIDQVTSVWTITPELKPDILVAGVKNKKTTVTFITDTDSITVPVKVGSVFNFIILLAGKDSAWTQVKGIKENPPAVFSKKYRTEQVGKTSIEVPEVYELLNIIFAITGYCKTDPNLVYKKGEYYNSIINWFDKYNNTDCVRTIDSLLRKNMYFQLKMDAYAFEFNKAGTIVRSKIYDRVSWGKSNTLVSYIPLLQEFARQSSFRSFYRQNESVYKKQEQYFRDTIQIQPMQQWLNLNFPGTSYNSFKVIFSPLVAWCQSANWFTSNGFREAQAHVNFPYPADRLPEKEIPADVITIRAGNLLFTELNHAFINVEANKYAGEIQGALTDLSSWIEKGKPSESYNNVEACFNEYMNWGLVSLRYIDLVPVRYQEKLIADNSYYGTWRGFKKFKAFNIFLVDLYRNRPQGKTVADLYPQIIEWFRENQG